MAADGQRRRQPRPARLPPARGLALLAAGRLAAGRHARTRPRWWARAIPSSTACGAILATAEDPDPAANLALLGDKRFLFSPSGESFLMFGVRGRTWVALGPPVGKRATSGWS